MSKRVNIKLHVAGKKSAGLTEQSLIHDAFYRLETQQILPQHSLWFVKLFHGYK